MCGNGRQSEHAGAVTDAAPSRRLRRMTLEAPSPKQREFLMADARYVCYGGARGGGKSWAVRTKALLLALRLPGIRILIVRRSYPELYENHIRTLCRMTAGVAVWQDRDKTLRFPVCAGGGAGSTIHFGYCDSSEDVLRYQGQEYDVLFIDEATQLTEEQFIWLDACVRGVNPFPKRTYLTCNPGGVGHDWVKRRFLDGGETESVFIRATVYDNQALLQSDPGYLRMLQRLPDGMRQAWLDGNWDYYAGQYFTMFDVTRHTVPPFPLPDWWRVYRALDYGLDMLAVIWVALDGAGNAFVFRELCVSGLIVSEAARQIRAASAEPVIATFAPPDLWSRQKDSGKSMEELFRDNGVPLVRAGNRRPDGWMALAEWLSPPARSETGQEAGEIPPPRLRIFQNCRELIRCLPLLQRDRHHASDCATEPHDITHICDAARYFAVSRPVGKAQPAEPPSAAAIRRARALGIRFSAGRGGRRGF